MIRINKLRNCRVQHVTKKITLCFKNLINNCLELKLTSMTYEQEYVSCLRYMQTTVTA